MKNTYSDKNTFYGIYRGYVVYNEDDGVRGRIKVFVPGVYSSKYADQHEFLPWCLPAMSIFGGNAPNDNDECLNKETGWASVPHAGNYETGAQVFVFFENGDINYPIYFAAAQSGEGWISEHPNQHVFHSDNVRIRIDENVKDARSTCKFDSYNSKNSTIAKAQLEKDCKRNEWTFKDGNIEQLETRIDIEVEASNLNAINLNIYGNVNTHIDGNWFIEHIGNKYEYHEGDTFIKHKGSTHIEQDGHWNKIHNGNRSYKHEGKYLYNQTGDAMITRTGTLYEQINGDVTNIYGGNLLQKISKNTDQMYNGYRNEFVLDNLTLKVEGEYNGEVSKGITFVSYDEIDYTAKEYISFVTRKGNITLKTNGEFELLEDGNITTDGFTNLGNRGNIHFISTFGNINMQCVKNDDIANFCQKSVVVPWNPGFLAEIRENPLLNLTFNKYDATTKGLNFPTSIFDIQGFIEFFLSLPNLFIYDGLPVFFPTKMIIQNPNIPEPNNTNDLSWIPKFRSEATDWRNIPDDVYWKLPGRMMGNINIETWSGDINIKTESEIGCAGNINISACEKTGTMTGYKIGCVNISNSAKKRIYPDPRDLFFDSDFKARNQGQLNIFSHATNLDDAIKNKFQLLPPIVNGLIFSTFKTSLTVRGSDYDHFYLMNALNLLTNGNLEEAVDPELLNKIIKSEAPKLGCIKCIADYFLGVPGLQDLCYVTENLKDFSPWGFHKYGFSRFNPLDWPNPRGTFNILTLDYDKISLGDGHAIEEGFVDRELNGPNIGSFNINSSGDMNISNGHNFYQTTNASNSECKRTVTHVVTEKALDFYPPIILTNLVKGIHDLWSNTGGLIFEIDHGVIKILKILFGGIKIDTGIKILNIMPLIEYISLGWDNTKIENIGPQITYVDKHYDTYKFDLGIEFENMLDELMRSDLSKSKVEFAKDEYILQSYNGSYESSYKMGDDKSFVITEFTKDIAVDIYLNDAYHQYTWKDKKGCLSKVKTHDDLFHFHWKLLDTPPVGFPLGIGYPKWTFKNDYVANYNFGQGLTENKQSIETSEWFWHDDVNIVNNVLEPGESYIDFVDNKNVTTDSNGKSYFKSLIGAVPRDIRTTILEAAGSGIFLTENQNAGVDINKSYARTAGNDYVNDKKHIIGHDMIENFVANAIRSTTKTITYESPINTNVFTLHSDNIWEDEEEKRIYSTNQMTTIISGTHTSSEYDDDEDWDREESNNFEFNETGFSLNNIVLKNGTTAADSYSFNNIYLENGSNSSGSISGSFNNIGIKNGVNTPSASNIFSFENGGNGNSSENHFSLLNGINSLYTINNFDIVNGVIDENNSKIEEEAYNSNNLSINNGSGIKTTNIYTINNGLYTNNSTNLYSINNGTSQGKAGNAGVFNTISINNSDHNQEILLDGSIIENPNNESNIISGDIRVYTTNNLIENAGTSYTLNTPLQTENTVTKIFNNVESFTINTADKTTNVERYIVNNSETIQMSSVSGITLTSPRVVIDRIISTGEHHGDFFGRHIGDGGPAVGDKLWWATYDSLYYVVQPLNTPAPNVSINSPEIQEPVPAPVNTGIITPILLVIGKLINKFMHFELSFLEKYF
jgi:hypothetical protein